MADLFTGPFFPYLEECLLARVTAAKNGDPFCPVAVIVPTRPLGRRLQSILAGHGSWVNLHFLTFFTLSLSIVSAAGQEVAPIPPRAALLLLLRQVIQSHSPQDGYTDYFLTYRNSLARLLALFSRFTSYRVAPPPRITGIEKTLFSIYQSFQDHKRSGTIGDAEDIISQAADLLTSGIPQGLPRTFLLYGFYDLNPVQRRIVGLLNEKGDLAVFSPGGFSEKSEEFFAETAAFYRDISRTGDALNPPVASDHEPVILSVARGLFSASDRPRGEAGGFIELVTASGLHGEATAIALEIIRHREQNPSLGWRDFAVTMGEHSEFTRALNDAFSEFSIPAFFDGGLPLSSVPEIRYFIVLLSALEKGLPRDDIAFLVTSAIFAWPGLPAADEPWVRENAHLLSAIARQNRVISGRKEWENAFLEYEKHPPAPDPLDEEAEGAAWYEQQRLAARYCKTVRPIVTGFLQALSDIPAEGPLSEYHDRFTALIDTYVCPLDKSSPAIQYLREVIAALPAASNIRHSITREDCIDLIREVFSEHSVSSPDDLDTVFVSDVMGVRGLSREIVFLMGMNEKVFPRSLSRDPFLSDRTAHLLGLPTTGTRSLEDRTLFALAVGSARGRLIVTRQRSDDEGRTSSPSPFLVELASRITIGGAPVNLASPLTGESGRDYPRLIAADRGLSRYRGQDVRASLCLGWPRDEDLQAVRGVVSSVPFLRNGLAALDERSSDRPFSVYDGLIGRAPGLLDAVLPLSSHKLETYASCPFDFFMRYILAAQQQDDIEEELDVEPRELGLLYHRTLSKLFPVLVQKGLFSPSGGDPEIINGLVNGGVRKEVGARLLGRIPSLILRAREEHAARIIGRLVGRERDQSRSGFIPALYEVKFGSGGDEQEKNPVLMLTIGSSSLPFVGRIDRIDVNESMGAFSVVDYKRKKPSGTRRLRTDIESGRHFQLPVYLMAAEALIFDTEHRPAGGALMYLEAPDETRYRETLTGDEYEETRDIVKERIGAVIEKIDSGRFTPSRGASCSFCSYRDLCRSDIKAIGRIRGEKTACDTGESTEYETDHDR